MIRLCECGFASDDPDWLEGHADERPRHREQGPW